MTLKIVDKIIINKNSRSFNQTYFYFISMTSDDSNNFNESFYE